MKKLLGLLLVCFMALSLVACGGNNDEPSTTDAPVAQESEYKIAMITDYGDITDQSFNQTTYEACKDFSDANGVEFKYFKPQGDSTPERVAMIEMAIDEGFNIVVMPGFAFGEAIYETAPNYPEVKFVALDVSEFDLGAPNNGDSSYISTNVYSMVYQEELCGYMAGYAAVKLGYTNLGFLGGMAVPAVIRYGYGYIQGADDAAKELGVDVTMNYAYGNQFVGSPDITAAMDTWYSNGTQVVFASGGGIYTSAAEAAVKAGGKVIGVDVDQAPTIDSAYAEGLTVTSAMKGLYQSTFDTLKTIILEGKWDTLVGKVANLGIVSENSEENYVGLPTETTQFSNSFNLDDYKALVAKLFSGEITVDSSADSEVLPEVEAITVNNLGNLK